VVLHPERSDHGLSALNKDVDTTSAFEEVD
jgi:hypothetical protein